MDWRKQFSSHRHLPSIRRAYNNEWWRRTTGRKSRVGGTTSVWNHNYRRRSINYVYAPNIPMVGRKKWHRIERATYPSKPARCGDLSAKNELFTPNCHCDLEKEKSRKRTNKVCWRFLLFHYKARQTISHWCQSCHKVIQRQSIFDLKRGNLGSTIVVERILAPEQW